MEAAAVRVRLTCKPDQSQDLCKPLAHLLQSTAQAPAARWWGAPTHPAAAAGAHTSRGGRRASDVRGESCCTWQQEQVHSSAVQGVVQPAAATRPNQHLLVQELDALSPCGQLGGRRGVATVGLRGDAKTTGCECRRAPTGPQSACSWREAWSGGGGWRRPPEARSAAHLLQRQACSRSCPSAAAAAKGARHCGGERTREPPALVGAWQRDKILLQCSRDERNRDPRVVVAPTAAHLTDRCVLRGRRRRHLASRLPARSLCQLTGAHACVQQAETLR